MDGDDIPPCMADRTCRPIDINQQVPLKWALPLYGHVMPIIVLLTVATNSFIVVVLSHRYLRTPTNFVLLAMAVSELLTGLCCVPWLLYYYTLQGFETDMEFGLSGFWCTMFPYMAFILPSIFHTTAIWLTVYLAVQRYIYICIPKLVRSYCTIRRSKQVIMVICIASGWLYAPDTIATYNRSYDLLDNSTNATRRVCFRHQSAVLHFFGPNLYYNVVFAVHTILVHFIPCILLVIFTWKLIRAIRLADKRHAHLLSRSTRRKFSELASTSDGGHKDSTASANIIAKRLSKIYKRGSICESRRVQGLKQNTRMLIVVILLFLLTEIPAAMIFSVHVFSVMFRLLTPEHYQVLNVLLIIRNILIVISYPFRFAIYCGMSAQFRDVVRQMFTARLLFWTRSEKSKPSTMALLHSNPERETSDEKNANGVLTSTVSGELSSCDKSTQCDTVSSGGGRLRRRGSGRAPCLMFDPFLDDLTGVIDEEPDGIVQQILFEGRRDRAVQVDCVENDIFVPRRESLLKSALIENTVMAQAPVVLSMHFLEERDNSQDSFDQSGSANDFAC